MRKIFNQIKTLRYLVRSRTPAFVLLEFLRSRPKRKELWNAQRTWAPRTDSQFSTDWFLGPQPVFGWIFKEFIDNREAEVKGLEIGSWEGQSVLYFLSELPKSRFTCVDTWQGGDEHQDAATYVMTEERFNHNTTDVRERIIKFKGTSREFFAQHKSGDLFDFVYVDGSHRRVDVLLDAIESFESLRPGGILVFDDFLWINYPRVIDNPCNAIGAFLRTFRKDLEILFVGGVVAVRKKAVGSH